MFMGAFSAIIEVTRKSGGVDHGILLNSIGRKFHLNSEMSFPAYYSSMLLWVACLIIGYIAYVEKEKSTKYWKHWILLSVLFLALSIDEMLAIHEEVTEYLRISLNISGPGQYAWAIVGTAFVIVLFIFFAKFLFSLPFKTQVRLYISAAVFLGGALGMELIGGYFGDADTTVLYHNIFVIIEESMEMFGVILFIRALLLYLREEWFNDTSHSQ